MISPELQLIYASAPQDKLSIQAISMYHPEFPEDIHLNDSAINITHLLYDGTPVLFKSWPFQINLPENSTNATQQVTIGMSNIDRSYMPYLMKAAESKTPIRLVFAEYTTRPGDAPLYQPVEFHVTTVAATNANLAITAGRYDVLNIGFPRRIYKEDTFPGLSR